MKLRKYVKRVLEKLKLLVNLPLNKMRKDFDHDFRF